MLSSDLPYATWSGGYHDVMFEIQKELANIGIELEITMYDSWTIWSSCWEENWNVSSVDALPPDGWDITCTDWWTQFTSTVWTESFCEDEWVPPLGYNIMPWTNEEADELLKAGIYSLDAETRKFNLWAWQEMYMHDPPMINMFVPYYLEIIGDYVEGYSGQVWFSEVLNLGLHADEMPSARQALGNTTFLLGCATDMPNVMSLYMSGYTQSAYQYLTQDTLYMTEIDYNASAREYIPFPIRTEPHLAADLPTYLNDTTAIVPLRDDVWWVWPNGSKSEKLDAYDAEYSIETVLDPDTGSPSQGEFIPAIESVDVLSNATLQSYGLWPTMYEPFAIQINLKAPFGDLTDLLGMNWGAGMLPEHLLGDIPRRNLRTSAYYSDPNLWCFTGPYIFEKWVKGQYVKVKVNPHYYGRDMTGIVDDVIIRIIPNDATRLQELKTFKVDALEFIWGTEEELDPALWPGHHIFQTPAPQSNLLVFNLDNPYLSNRYVRQAIAHAIPYDRIYSEILPGWGILDVIPDGAKTIINPYTNYTEPIVPGDPDLTGSKVSLFNTDLEPFEYNLTKAEKYMDMWRLSQVGETPTLGPVGDTDFSGHVEMDDFVVWANAIVDGTLTSPWSFLPGNDIDPDCDNSDYVELADYYDWRENFGMYYPERSLTHEWSR
jgi:ABC-type transport system substrate-binding protein